MNAQSTKLWVLLATGFDEAFVAQSLCQFEAVGATVMRVGLQAQKVASQAGGWLRPDEYLVDCNTLPEPPAGLILPGGEACATQLLIDPRVHQLVGKMLKRRQLVVGAAAVAQVWRQMGAAPPSGLLWEMPGAPTAEGFLAAAAKRWQRTEIFPNVRDYAQPGTFFE